MVPLLRGRGLKVAIEPGRYIAGNAGILLARVLYRKAGGEKSFVITDAAMNDLIRPAFYGSFHFIWPAHPRLSQAEPFARDKHLHVAGGETVDVVGPICESGDFLAKDRVLPPTQRGDLLAIFTAGAYGFAMSSNYNNRPRAAEVLVDGPRHRLIRRRETYEDLVAAERVD
jgi:diaminopimelate decarboxylase